MAENESSASLAKLESVSSREMEVNDDHRPQNDKEISKSKAEEPKAEEPKAEEPKAEEPKAEEPKAEEPKAEESKDEGSTPEESKDEGSTTDEMKKSPRKPEIKYETEKLFEMEDPEGLGDDWLDKPYVPPSLEKAIDKGFSQRFLAGKAEYFETTIKELGSEGVGMGLYFLILRSLATIFLVMTVISVPSLVFNCIGAGVSPEEQDALNLAYTTLGNQGLSEDNINPLGGCIEHSLEWKCGDECLFGDESDLSLSECQIKSLDEISALLQDPILSNFTKYVVHDNSITTEYGTIDIVIVDKRGNSVINNEQRAFIEESLVCEVLVDLRPEVGIFGFKEQSGVDCSQRMRKKRISSSTSATCSICPAKSEM